MKSIFYSKIKNLPLYDYDNSHCESNILVDTQNNKLYKVLLSDFRSLEREKTVETFHELNLDGCINPIDKIVDYNKMNIGRLSFMGFSMKYYETFTRLLSNKNIALKKRKELIVLMNQIYRSILQNGYNYWDIKDTNILTDGNKVLFADIDSCLDKKTSDHTHHYKSRVNLGKRNLYLLSLSLLINHNVLRIGSYDSQDLEDFKRTICVDSLDKELLSNLLRTSDIDSDSVPYFDEKINSYKDENIEESLTLIKKNYSFKE